MHNSTLKADGKCWESVLSGTCAARPQPSPRILELLGNILILSEGKVVFQGRETDIGQAGAFMPSSAKSRTAAKRAFGSWRWEGCTSGLSEQGSSLTHEPEEVGGS